MNGHNDDAYADKNDFDDDEDDEDADEDDEDDDGEDQAAISWRASVNRQISLNASAECAFANFRDKNIVFYNCKFSLALIALR